MPVPLFDTATPLEPLRGRLNDRAAAVLDAGRYILGPEVAAFEEEFAAYAGVSHGIGVANGTDAITIALRAMGVGDGDDVVVPSFTFYASVEAIPPTGAAAGVLRRRSRHLLRDPGDGARGAHPEDQGGRGRRPVRERRARSPTSRRSGVPVLEDAAQAAGSTPRRRARRLVRHGRDLLVLSLQEPRRLRRRRHGRDRRRRRRRARAQAALPRLRDKVTYTEVGYNSRLDELQAGLLRVLLPELDGWCDGRRTAVRHYEEAGLAELVRLPRPVEARRPGLAPLRDPPSERRAARPRAGARGDRLARLLPHAGPPAARDAAYPRRRAASGNRRGRGDAPRDPDEPGAQPRRRPSRSSPRSSRRALVPR